MQQSSTDGPNLAQLGKKRLHELDWFRALMVILVVYAHISRSGMRGGVYGKIANDDRIYNMVDPSPLGVRWISSVRQYCLPLLFFVSGAACACSFKKTPGSFGKIIVYTFLGVSLNAALWLLGPQNPDCDPCTAYGRAECQGAVFDFTICPFSGKIFPIVFQMWYTAMLLVLMLLNWPLFAFLRNNTCSSALILQLIMTIGVQAALAIVDESITKPWLVIGLMALTEVLFVALSITGKKLGGRPELLRFLHYGLGALATLQFGCIPIAPEIEHISTAFMLFIFCGFNKSFQLGFVLTLARLPGQHDVLPIVSLYWPMMAILRTLTAPSTNWYAAGNLTYPYYPRLLDRADYVAGAVVVMFVVDRLGRMMNCKPLPAFMGYGALLLYLLHPWMMALLIVAVRGTRLEDTGSIWIMCILVSGLAGFVATCPWRSCAARSPKQYGTSSDSEASMEEEDSHGSA